MRPNVNALTRRLLDIGGEINKKGSATHIRSNLLNKIDEDRGLTDKRRQQNRKGNVVITIARNKTLRPLSVFVHSLLSSPAMQFFTSPHSLLGIALASLTSSTARVGVADAAIITLEPLVSNPDYTFAITSNLNVANKSTNGGYDDAFPIDLYSSDRIEFVLQPPPNANQMRLSSFAPGDAIEVIFRASLVDGPDVDKCQNSVIDTKEEDNIFNELSFGALFKASVIGRDADMLVQAFAWERSYVSMQKYGCALESRLFFQPTEDDGIIQATIEKISWSAKYEVASIGGAADRAMSLYELRDNGLMIKGGDVSFDIVAGVEKMSLKGMDAAKGAMYPSVSLTDLLPKTPRAQTAAKSITLEPWVPNSDYTFVVTSILNVANINSEEGYGNQFAIDPHSSHRIEFVLQPPYGADEMMLLSSAPGEAIEVVFRAILVDGPNKDKCITRTADSENEGNAFDQPVIGDFNKLPPVGQDLDMLSPTNEWERSNIRASVMGRDADMLVQAFAWERSYVSMQKYGCALESRLFFQPTEDDGIIQATIEKISWSAKYEVASIGGAADRAMSLYELRDNGLMIKGGDVLFDIDGSLEQMAPISGGHYNTIIWSFGLFALMLFLGLLSVF